MSVTGERNEQRVSLSVLFKVSVEGGMMKSRTKVRFISQFDKVY